MDVSEQNRHDVLAIAAPVIGAVAIGLNHTRLIQLDGHIIGLIAASLHLGYQSVIPFIQADNGAAIVVISTSAEGFIRG
jgi:hypothetical protein